MTVVHGACDKTIQNRRPCVSDRSGARLERTAVLSVVFSTPTEDCSRDTHNFNDDHD